MLKCSRAKTWFFPSPAPLRSVQPALLAPGHCRIFKGKALYPFQRKNALSRTASTGCQSHVTQVGPLPCGGGADPASSVPRFVMICWQWGQLTGSPIWDARRKRGTPQKSDRCDSDSTRRGEHTCPSERIMLRLSRPEWPWRLFPAIRPSLISVQNSALIRHLFTNE